MSYTLYAAGYATGHPSPGGLGCVITFGKNIVQLYSRELNKTSSTHATLCAVRDGLRLIDEHSKVQVALADNLSAALINGETKAHQQELQKLCTDIEDIVWQKKLTVSTISSKPGTIALLDQAIKNAKEAAEHSWSTGNSPSCPKCLGKMETKHQQWGSYWQCERFPDCKGRINIYQEGDG